MYPLVSIILPVFNSEKFLREAIDSVLKQSVVDFELLIIYDKSSDSSLDIINEYLSFDSRVSIVNGTGEGLSTALNLGLKRAKGKYVARMDSDDISLPNRLEKQISLLEACNADICGCHWFVVNKNLKYFDVKIVPTEPYIFPVWLSYTVPFAHGSVLMRRSFIIQNNLIYGGVKYAEDYDLWIKFHECAATFINVNEFLYIYRDYDYSVSKIVSSQNNKDSRRLRRYFVNKYAESINQSILLSIENYSNLSQSECVLLLNCSYLLLIQKRSFLFFKVLSISSKRSIGLFILYFIKGI
jgi:glycosyltransferase involved in cell wall biosynthesis